jgi:hypothetical protein
VTQLELQVAELKQKLAGDKPGSPG